MLLPLKRNRSPSPDDATKPTILRPEKKKPKLMASGKPSMQYAGKKRLLRMLQRAVETSSMSGNPSIDVLVNNSSTPTSPTSDMASGAALASGDTEFTKSEFISQEHHSATEALGIAKVNNGRLESLECDEVRSSSDLDGPLVSKLFDNPLDRVPPTPDNVDAHVGEPVTQMVNRRSVQSFLAWKSHLSHMQRLRRSCWIPQYELKRAVPRKKKDDAKIRYKLKTSDKEHVNSATHAADSPSLSTTLPAMLTDDAGSSSLLGNGEVVPYSKFSANPSVVIPDTPLSHLFDPPVTSPSMINNGCLPLIDPETSTIPNISPSNSRGIVSTDEPSDATAPSLESRLSCEAASSSVVQPRIIANGPFSEICSPASSLPFTLQNSGFPNAEVGVGHTDIIFDSYAMPTPHSDTDVCLISTADHVEASIKELNKAIFPANEMSGSHFLSSKHEIPAFALDPRCVGSQLEFAQGKVALPTASSNRDMDFVNSVDPVSGAASSPLVNFSAPISQFEPITELGAVSLNVWPEPVISSTPTTPVILPPATPGVFAPRSSTEQNGHPPPPPSTKIPQTTDIPHPMDVDITSSLDSNLEGYTSDSNNQARSDILESAIYHHVKSQPFNHSSNDTLAKIVEMLAPAKSPTRLPKGLRGRGQARQYDVPRANNELKTCVREYAHHLLGQMPWDVPSESELLAFENGRAPGPTMRSFRLDLASQGLASRWNVQAAEIFADAFLNEDELVREFSDREAILSAFVVHLITLQKRHRQPILHAKMTEGEINGERDKQKQKAREQRKRGLFRRRINATKDYEVDPLLKTLLTSFWPYCTPEVMSDDETDSEWDGLADQIPHFIKVMNWRNPVAVDFFRVFDALYFSTRFKGNKWSPGRFPHTRVPSVRLKECNAIPGLPVNFYSPQWLLQLSDIERRKLNARPAIELDFSQNILRIAARFLHIRQRKQLPLPRDHPALQGITKSTYPAGFPLDDRLQQASNEGELTPAVDTPESKNTSVPDVEQNCTTSRSSQSNQSNQDEFMVPAQIPQGVSPMISATPNSIQTPSTLNGIPLHPVSTVSLVGLPGDHSSRPRFLLINQEGGSRFPGSYMVALDAVSPAGSIQPVHVPTQSSYPINVVPLSFDANSTSNASLPKSNTDQQPFALRKHKGKRRAS